jgi:hypothetical protein
VREALSSSGPGRYLLKVNIRGSNPLSATQLKIATLNIKNRLIFLANPTVRSKFRLPKKLKSIYFDPQRKSNQGPLSISFCAKMDLDDIQFSIKVVIDNA